MKCEYELDHINANYIPENIQGEYGPRSTRQNIMILLKRGDDEQIKDTFLNIYRDDASVFNWNVRLHFREIYGLH